MTSRPVVLHEEAAAEYEAAFDWYFERSRLAASRFALEVNAALGQIGEAPHRWPKHIHGTRKFVLQRFPFVIVYRESSVFVEVLAVAHGRRRPGYWKERVHPTL